MVPGQTPVSTRESGHSSPNRRLRGDGTESPALASAQAVELLPVFGEDLAARLGPKRRHGLVHVLEWLGPESGRVRKIGFEHDIVIADLVDQFLKMPATGLEPHGGV